MKTASHFDALLAEEIWPGLRSHLEKTGYLFSPVGVPEIKSEASRGPVRSLQWMLFDETGKTICKMTIECQHDVWAICNEFYLELPADTDIGIIKEILGNSRFSGCPPVLLIDKTKAMEFYQVTFRNGAGEGWGVHDKKHIIETAKHLTDAHIRMYEATFDGITTQEDLADFLTVAYEIYEAH